MSRPQAIGSVTDGLFAAATSRDAWSPALDALVRLFGSDHALLFAGDERAPFIATAGLSRRELARLTSPEGLRLATPVQRLFPPGIAVPGETLVPERDMVRTEYYNEIIRPMGTHYGVAARQNAPTSLRFGLCRNRRAGAYRGDEVRMIQLILPFLTTAVELQQRLAAAAQREAGLLQMIDRLDTAVILTDAHARPLLVNERAARIADEADGLLLHHAVTAATPEATRRLRKAIAAMAADTACESRRLRLERPSGRSPLMLTLMPVWRLGAAVPGAGAPRVAIFVTESDAPVVIDLEMLADSFRLTRRESEVAALLAGGLDLAQVATRLGIGIWTARFHLRHAFDKTGARNQVALAALVRGFAHAHPRTCSGD